MRIIQAVIGLLASAAIVASHPLYNSSSTDDSSSPTDSSPYSSPTSSPSSDSSYMDSQDSSGGWYSDSSNHDDECKGFRISSSKTDVTVFVEYDELEITFDFMDSKIKRVEYVDIVRYDDYKFIDIFADGPWYEDAPTTGTHEIHLHHADSDYYIFKVVATSEDGYKCTYRSEKFKVTSHEENYHSDHSSDHDSSSDDSSSDPSPSSSSDLSSSPSSDPSSSPSSDPSSDPTSDSSTSDSSGNSTTDSNPPGKPSYDLEMNTPPPSDPSNNSTTDGSPADIPPTGDSPTDGPPADNPSPTDGSPTDASPTDSSSSLSGSPTPSSSPDASGDDSQWSSNIQSIEGDLHQVETDVEEGQTSGSNWSADITNLEKDLDTIKTNGTGNWTDDINSLENGLNEIKGGLSSDEEKALADKLQSLKDGNMTADQQLDEILKMLGSLNSSADASSKIVTPISKVDTNDSTPLTPEDELKKLQDEWHGGEDSLSLDEEWKSYIQRLEEKYPDQQQELSSLEETVEEDTGNFTNADLADTDDFKTFIDSLEQELDEKYGPPGDSNQPPSSSDNSTSTSTSSDSYTSPTTTIRSHW